ncbi:MAG: hypothetical protein HOV83_40130 [Catenulispora sp.]|nr:hypothetical protein [Catenulispora sp.]
MIATLGRTVMTYRGCLRRAMYVVVSVAGLLLGGGLAGVLLETGSAAAVLAIVWLAVTVRVLRAAPVRGGGGPGPGGAGVREPRHPLPGPPGDAIALPLPEDPPGGAAALA